MNTEQQIREERWGKRIIRRLLGAMPLGVGITGPARDRLLHFMDVLFRQPGHSDELERMTTDDGREFVLRVQSPNERLISYFYGNLLRHYRRSAFYDVLRMQAADSTDSMTFVDVGANLGIYCLLAGELGFETVAVEPEPLHSDFLTRHDHLFGAVHSVAVGDVEETADFFVATNDNPGASSLVLGSTDLADSSIYEESVPVSVVRLDRLFETFPSGGSSIGVIKIDVEGHEAAAVRGLAEFLDAGNRPCIWCEVRGPQSGRNPSSYRDVTELLSGYGYDAFRWADGKVPFRHDEADVPQVFDLLFV